MPLFSSSKLMSAWQKQPEWAYKEVSPTEDGEVSEASEKSSLQGDCVEVERCRKRDRLSVWLLLINVILCSTSLVFFGLTARRYHLSDDDAIRQTNAFSPILSAVDIRLKNIQVNGTLYPPRIPSFSRQEPGNAEAEAIWESFENGAVFPITREELLRLGKDPETAVKFPDEHFGLGDEAYVASLDITHKLHCLNELRKMTFGQYPTSDGSPAHYKSEFDSKYHSHGKHGKLWWYHLRHCVDLLTQDLMCYASADVLTYNFRDTQIHPFPDFSINRKCKDFDQLLEYRDQHQVNLDDYVDLVRYDPKGTTKLVPYEKEFYEMHGFKGSILFPNGKGFEDYWAAHW